jgi:peptide/nickel transport system permease protein
MSAGFARFLVSRLLRAALTVWGVVTLVFLLVRLIPGDPIDAILGDQASPEDRAALRVALRLDRPLPAQYAGFVSDVLDGSLGHSFRRRTQTVSSMVSAVLAPTLMLAFAAMFVAWMIALPLGVLAAVQQGSAWDRAASTVALIGMAIPTIWLGPLLILAFGVRLQWLPLPGDEQLGVEGLLLPSLTIGTALAAILTRQSRGAMVEVLSENYITAARARGVGPAAVVIKHALRNALLPVVTVGAAQFGAVLSGTVVTERIFERQGLGTLFLDAFFTRDIPVVQGCVLIIALVYVMVNLGLDVVYGLIDPRVRLT